MTGNGGCTSDTGEEALETAFTSKDGSRRETYPIVFVTEVVMTYSLERDLVRHGP
jgi:hypothetical protein